MAEKRAPVQGYAPGIPWSLHLEAYAAYCKKWGPQPAMIDLEGRNCRGGFSVGELDEFVPGWRERVDGAASAPTPLEELRRVAQVTGEPLDKLVADCNAMSTAYGVASVEAQSREHRVASAFLRLLEAYESDTDADLIDRPAWARDAAHDAKQMIAGVPGTPAPAYGKTYGTENHMQRPAGYEVWATDVQPSDETGAWTCKACGFRGFWRGGPHCGPAGVPASHNDQQEADRG